MRKFFFEVFSDVLLPAEPDVDVIGALSRGNWLSTLAVKMGASALQRETSTAH